MAEESEVRQRRGKADAVDSSEGEGEPAPASPGSAKAKKTKPVSPESKVDDEDAYSPYVDVLRVLTFLLLASCALSYLVSSGESWFWGMKNPPKYLQAQWWRSQFHGPLRLTPAELAAYDGTDESKPIYLAINGTIYDVTAGRRIYGPGGSYHHFAGIDAARGFVTGCFADDRTADLRGVEEMYLPLDDPRVDRHWPAAELARMREAELAEARQKAYGALKHWVDFFAKSKKYHFVGYLVREPGWEEKEPRRTLCKQAMKGRTPRKLPGET